MNGITCDNSCFSATAPQFPLTIEGGAKSLVNIRFEPDRAGRISGTLTIETDDPDPNEEFCRIELSGRGEDNSPPVISRAGFMGGYISAGQSDNLTVRADVSDPDGDSQISSVTLFIGTLEGIQIGSFEMLDDGQDGDIASGDGVYTKRFWVDSAPAGIYTFEIVAEDLSGAASDVWPYMNISSEAASGNDSFWGQYPGQGEGGDPGGPVIVMAGFENTSISQEGGGELICTAEVDDYLDAGNIDRVELRFGGNFAGIYLTDDGQGHDEHAGDMIYTGGMSLTPGYPAGDYLLEIVAIDLSGLESVAYPYYVIR